MWRGSLRRLLGKGTLARFRPSKASPTALRRPYAAQAERKRFYQNVSISQGENGFEINLDSRKLRTPQAKLFTVPSEPLALAVATEWDSQQDTVKFYTMHLTNLCNTALDNPSQRSKDQLIQAALKFLETDTICYRVEEPPALVELQKNEWDPVIEWAEKRYNVVIGSSTSIMGPTLPQSTKDTFISHLASYNSWALQGIEYMITQLKSLILSMSLVDKHLTVEQAVLLSRLEEEYQIQRWGNVEWAHDYERAGFKGGFLDKPWFAQTVRPALLVHKASKVYDSHDCHQKQNRRERKGTGVTRRQISQHSCGKEATHPLVLLLKLMNDSGALVLVVFQGFVEALIENGNLILSPLVLLQAVFKQGLANLDKFTLVGVVGVKEAINK